MCGIAGVVQSDLSPGEWEKLLRTMAEALIHRGPDDEGIWFDGQAGIGLAHRRLSILDLSPLGHQPMRSASGRYVVTFNGEIYNFRALRRELEGLGHRFRGHSDTEVLLASAEQWGVDAAVRRFNGMFAFALWDQQTCRLHLVRDRIGEKPLYYGRVGKGVVFASELKALRTHPDFSGKIDRNAVALFLRYNYVPAPHSIYEGISKLPAGTMVTLEAGAPLPAALPTPVPYWSARDMAERGAAAPFQGTEEQAAEELDALLRDAVKLRMVADVPLGAFLSGGIDSSAVVALMQVQSERPVRTFSIGFHEAAYDEARHASGVARFLGTCHTELYVTPAQAQAVIPRLPALYDEPFADASQIPMFLVSQLARRDVTVSLSGDGGDEIFGGYSRYFWGPQIWRSIAWMPAAMRAAASRLLRGVPLRSWDALGAAAACLPQSLRVQHPGGKLQKLAGLLAVESPHALYGGLVSIWEDPASVVAGSPAISDEGRWADLKDFQQAMMFWDTATYLPDDILVKLDRASMGVSLETRLPFLDHRVVEFAWRLPVSMKVRRSQGKWLLRQVLAKYVPRIFVDRPKQGFCVPIDSWLRGPLRDWAEALLDEGRLRTDGLFNPRPIRRTWSEHLLGRRNRQYPLWGVLMFQAWREQV